MEVVGAIVLAIWVMLPAYLPNNVAVLAGGGTPIDGGQMWRGKRILGDGKTWRGTAIGILTGVLVALGLNSVHASASTVLGVDLPAFAASIVLAFPVGAMIGDMLASFLKRRTGRARGTAFPLVDQLDFVVVALLAGVLVDPAWMFEVFTPLLFVIVLILTPILHVTTNGIAYLLGLKQEPW